MENIILLFIIAVVPSLISSYIKKQNQKGASSEPGANKPQANHRPQSTTKSSGSRPGTTVRNIQPRSASSPSRGSQSINGKQFGTVAALEQNEYEGTSRPGSLPDFSEEGLQREGVEAASANALLEGIEVEAGEELETDISENLVRSIIAVEILGPPRSMKKRIR